MMSDPNLLARFTKRPAVRDTNWSLWERLQFGQSLFKRVHNGQLEWAWGENPYTCAVENIHATKEAALYHYIAVTTQDAPVAPPAPDNTQALAEVALAFMGTNPGFTAQLNQALNEIKRLQGYLTEADEKLLQRDQDYDDCLVEVSRLEKEIVHLEKLLAKAE